MTPSSKTILACLLPLAAAGCLTVGEDDLPEVDSDPVLEETQLQCLSPGCQEQGRTLLSAVLDVDEYLSFPLVGMAGGVNVPLMITPAGALRRQNGAALPANLVLTADNGATVEIVSVVTPPAGEPGPQYELFYTGPTFTGNPCVHGTAIAIDGDFDHRAHHDEDSVKGGPDHRFSLACKDEGTAYKCKNFGYPPGNDPDLPPWKAHQVCTRALRADICKGGDPYTLDETNVRIWDNYPALGFPDVTQPFRPLTVWPPPPDVFRFESIWPEDDDEPVLCLGKERWQALQPGELDGACGVMAPPDPRTDPDALFCDDGVDIPANSLTVASRWTDLLLEEWEHTGGDLAVSVTGYFDGGAGHVIGKRPFGNAPDYTHVQTLGTILRSLPGSIDKSEVIKVYTYSDLAGADHVLAGDVGATWTPPLPGRFTKTLEGMVFVDQPAFPPTVALHAYETPSGELYNGLEPRDPRNDTDHGRIGYILGPAE